MFRLGGFYYVPRGGGDDASVGYDVGRGLWDHYLGLRYHMGRVVVGMGLAHCGHVLVVALPCGWG